jgi:hypothetical protein
MGRSLTEAAQFVLDSLGELGINVPPGSRLDRMCRVLRNPDGSSRGVIPEGDSDYQVAREALRDITELEFVFEHGHLDADSQELRKILDRLIGDSVFPQKDTQKSPGCDAQTELFVFALCQKGGLAPRLTEPDIVCSVAGRRVALAVKRVKGMNKLTDRIREGASQVKKSGLNGIVLAEITLAVNRRNHEVFAPEPHTSLGPQWSGRMERLVDQEYRHLQMAVRDKEVIGVVLHEHQVSIDSRGQRRLESMTYTVPMCDNRPDLRADLDTFRTQYVGALPNLVILG